MAYQIIQLSVQATDNINCPHCQQAVINWSEEQYVQPCEHTLFIAMDIGFEYMTDEFEQTLRRTVDDMHANDDQVIVIDELAASNYPNFVIYQSDLGVEGYSRYVGISA